MPLYCGLGVFFRWPNVVKSPFGAFFTKDGAFFRSEGLATLPRMSRGRRRPHNQLAIVSWKALQVTAT